MNDRSATPELADAQRLPLGHCVLDLAAGELLGVDGQLTPLRKQALSVLLILGARAGQVVSKDELTQQVWPKVVVGEGSLTQAVVDIRRALGDHDHRLVRNVARRGYMLMPSSDAASASPPLAPAPVVPVPAAPAAVAVKPARWRWAAAALALVLALAFAAWMHQEPATNLVGDLSIVVLPLAAEGSGADVQAFADVLHNDLIAELSRADIYVVIARGTAATYRDKVVDPRSVARELNVRHVVGGSLRREGDHMRLSLTLVDGESGVQRWAEVFEFERARLGGVLDEAVAQLARALYINVSRSAAVRAEALSPAQVTADDLAMRATGMWYRGLTRDNVLEMLSLAEQAVAADPNSIRGWAEIAGGLVQSLNNDWIVGAEARSAARQRAEQASAALDRIAPDSFVAMQARVIEAYNRQDFAAMLQRAHLWVERHRNPYAYGALGSALFHNDQPEAALQWFERALRVSPLDPFRAEWMYRLAWSQYMLGNLDQAVAWGEKAQSVNPRLPWPPVHAAAQLQLGRRAEAQSSWDEFRRRHPNYERTAILNRLGGDAPRFAAARAHLIESLVDLGLK